MHDGVFISLQPSRSKACRARTLTGQLYKEIIPPLVREGLYEIAILNVHALAPRLRYSIRSCYMNVNMFFLLIRCCAVGLSWYIVCHAPSRLFCQRSIYWRRFFSQTIQLFVPCQLVSPGGKKRICLHYCSLPGCS